MKNLRRVDPVIAEVIDKELKRQQHTIELIASENFTSEAVLEAAGSVLTNKYAEGYPGNRYYGGCANVDVAEKLAIERAKELFGAEYVNAQPHSGSQANMAVFFSTLDVGDTILGLDLAHGGHLTHGSPVNFSGRFYNVIPYTVDAKTELIDYESVRDKAIKHRPKMIITGASAYPRTIDFASFREIADEVGAKLMVDMAHIAGLVAAGIHESPVPYADFVTTTTHKTLRGPRSGMILCRKEYGPAVDKMIFPGIQGGPLMHIIAAKAVALKEAMSPEFKEYQAQVVSNAKALAKCLTQLGFRIVSGGTDTHLVLVDLSQVGVTGKEAEELLDEVGITVNKNAIPFDRQGPRITSGIRLGSAAMTTRGLKEDEFKTIAEMIYEVLKNRGNIETMDSVSARVQDLCKRFPLYQEL